MVCTKAKRKPSFVHQGDKEPLPEPVRPEPAKRANQSLVLDMEGCGGEIASSLIVNGVRAYPSVVNKGVSLIAANRAHTIFVPVQVSACESDLDIKKDEAMPMVDLNGVLAFLVGDGDDRVSYFLPIAEYLEKAEHLRDSKLRLMVDEHFDWLGRSMMLA